MGRGAVTERVGVAQIRAAVRAPAAPEFGIGDDAALLTLGERVLACHDLVVEDVHFRRETHDLDSVGHKALAVNLSDIAAMGGVPRAALVGLTMPPGGLDAAELGALYAGMGALADAHGVAIVGGDTTRGAALSLAVTVLGSVPPGDEPLRRVGGVPGDLLCVTGDLGGAAAGLALLDGTVPRGTAGGREAALIAAQTRPVPRVAEGRALARGGAHAGIDISDGLLLDAERLAAESGCRALIDLERVPQAPGVADVAMALGVGPERLAATGGEDYELLVAIPQSGLAAIARRLPRGLQPVGVLTEGSGVEVRHAGTPVSMPRLGWELA